MGKVIRFPRRPHWTAIHLRFWNASLDRLTDYLARLRTREDSMSDVAFEYPADAPLMITTRTFEAPRALVWTCFSRPEHVARWWGPKSISPIVKLDKFEFRVGGKWRFVTQRPDGTQTIVFHGTYKDIVKPEKIVNTFAVESMYAEDDMLTETHTFEARGDTTFYRAVANLGTIEARDGVVAGGMEAGARESLGQLDELLADLMVAAK
jgi:uncharacterized protein YndB with AHSA1/START domain